ncbi:hypothetical protein [Desulfospira joergensenii]|uniref:hypothetical protein n=1 Tax=Desulfospira joergensenii TaxID=53329 RepID=UPI0003B3ACA0|nr:hypothetical protein [Desulfospira joergensenii]
MDRQEREKIGKRMAELEALILETQKRLPAHSVKPPVMQDLLAYEDEYEVLLKKLKEFKKGESCQDHQ